MVAQQPSRPVTLAGEAPQWARRAFADAEKGYVQAAPGRPQLLARFESTDLPAPAEWIWCIIAVTDKNTVAISTGSAWVRADGSAL